MFSQYLPAYLWMGASDILLSPYQTWPAIGDCSRRTKLRQTMSKRGRARKQLLLFGLKEPVPIVVFHELWLLQTLKVVCPAEGSLF